MTMTDYPVKCFTCKKAPKNCICFIYRIEKVTPSATVGKKWALKEETDFYFAVYVDNLATSPVRGEEVGTWESPRKKSIFRRPQFIDGYGPILYTWPNRDDLGEEIKTKIESGEFNLDDYKEKQGYFVPSLPKEIAKRFAVFRRPRRKV